MGSGFGLGCRITSVCEKNISLFSFKYSIIYLNPDYALDSLYKIIMANNFMPIINGLDRYQMSFSSLEDSISVDNEVRFIDAFVIQNRPSKTKFKPQLADKFLQNFHADIKKTAP